MCGHDDSKEQIRLPIIFRHCSSLILATCAAHFASLLVTRVDGMRCETSAMCPRVRLMEHALTLDSATLEGTVRTLKG